MPGSGRSLAISTAVKRQGWLTNDVYALQNLMESFLDFQPLTPQLSSITVPTMILNGEFDFLTPRVLHETAARPYSRQRARHHSPRLSCLHPGEAGADRRPAARFADDVLAERGKADKSVWIAPDEAGGPMLPFPPDHDHLRAIPRRDGAGMSAVLSARSIRMAAFRRGSRRVLRRS